MENSKKKLNISMSASPPPITPLPPTPLTTPFIEPINIKREVRAGAIRKKQTRLNGVVHSQKKEPKVGVLKRKQLVVEVQKKEDFEVESWAEGEATERTELTEHPSSTNLSISCKREEDEMLIPQEEPHDKEGLSSTQPAPPTPSFSKHTASPTPNS